ncbi:MAG: heavy-metal-associated domain-containing protein [Bacteroidota bacterium]|nr:heavy-metal-associated domain-containing protein [Bacteroidota bacterium]
MKHIRSILLATLVLFMTACGSEEESPPEAIHVSAPGMHCDGCTATVEETLGKLAGVDSVSADLDSKDVTVYCDTTVVARGDVEDIIAKLGFDVAPGEQ